MPFAGMREQIGRAALAGLAELLDVHRDVAQRVVVRRRRRRDDRQVDLQGGDPNPRRDAIGREGRARRRRRRRRQRRQGELGGRARGSGDGRRRRGFERPGVDRTAVTEQADGEERDPERREERGEEASAHALGQISHRSGILAAARGRRPGPLVLVPSRPCRRASPSWPACCPGSWSPPSSWAASSCWRPKGSRSGPRHRRHHRRRPRSASPSAARRRVRRQVPAPRVRPARPLPGAPCSGSVSRLRRSWSRRSAAGTIDLANLKGKPVWINFMATWCPPCQDEFPLMNGFAARYAADGLVVIAIDVKEDEGTVAAFAESLAATFPLGLDADRIRRRDVGRARPPGPLLDRCRRDRARWRPGRHRARHHGPRPADRSCRASTVTP